MAVSIVMLIVGVRLLITLGFMYDALFVPYVLNAGEFHPEGVGLSVLAGIPGLALIAAIPLAIVALAKRRTSWIISTTPVAVFAVITVVVSRSPFYFFFLLMFWPSGTLGQS